MHFPLYLIVIKPTNWRRMSYNFTVSCSTVMLEQQGNSWCSNSLFTLKSISIRNQISESNVHYLTSWAIKHFEMKTPCVQSSPLLNNAGRFSTSSIMKTLYSYLTTWHRLSNPEPALAPSAIFWSIWLKNGKTNWKKKSTERKKNSFKALKNPPSPESRSMIFSVQSALNKARCTPCRRVSVCVLRCDFPGSCSLLFLKLKIKTWPLTPTTPDVPIAPPQNCSGSLSSQHNNQRWSLFRCARAHHSPSYFLQYRKNPHGWGCAPSSSID